MLYYSLRNIHSRETFSGGYFPDRVMALRYYSKQLQIPLTLLDQSRGGAEFILTEKPRSRGITLTETPVWVGEAPNVPT
jgi:hypothetical protein